MAPPWRLTSPNSWPRWSAVSRRWRRAPSPPLPRPLPASGRACERPYARRRPAVRDWKQKAREVGARLTQQAAKEAAEQGGSTLDRQEPLVMRMFMHHAAEVERLESRVRELEGRGIKYCGTYQRALVYERGAVVTHQGSAWIALTDTGAEPGSDTAWQLMVKRGRDARPTGSG